MKIFLIFITLFSFQAFARSSMKGFDLYSWKDSKGIIHYALLDGTNMQKSAVSLKQNKLTLVQLEKELKALEKDSHVWWNNKITVVDSHKLNFTLPPQKIIFDIKVIAELQKIVLDIPELRMSKKGK